jgi:hypothetical protein
MKNRVPDLLLVVFLLAGASAQSSRAGSVIRLFYDGDSQPSNPTQYRQSVSTLTNYWAFPDGPDFREQLDDFFAISGQPLITG